MTMQPTDVVAPPEAPASTPPALITRARNILLQPRPEWDRIAAEQAGVAGLYFGYLLPIALVVGLIGFVSVSLFSGFLASWMIFAAAQAAFLIVSSLLGVFVIALIINAIAPAFGALPAAGQAHKLAVYSATAFVISSVFSFGNTFATLGLIGLYSYGLLWIGLPRVMKPPADKRLPYFAAIVVVSVVIALLVAGLVQSLVGWGSPLYFR